MIGVCDVCVDMKEVMGGGMGEVMGGYEMRWESGVCVDVGEVMRGGVGEVMGGYEVATISRLLKI